MLIWLAQKNAYVLIYQVLQQITFKVLKTALLKNMVDGYVWFWYIIFNNILRVYTLKAKY